MEQELDRIRELNAQREKYRLGGGLNEIEKQHKRDKLTARERMEQFFDSGTFRELQLWRLPLWTGFEIDERFSPADAVVIGYGKVEGRTVMAYAHDFTVLTGSQAAVQHRKVTKVIETASKMMIPYVGIVDSSGLRLQDIMGEPGPRPPMDGSGLHGTGSLMYSPPWTSGVIPQIAVMLGPQFAGSSYSPILKDFLIMRRSPAVFMSLASPPVIKQVTGIDVTYEEIGGAMLHAQVSGTCDVVVDSDEEGLQQCRRLLGFLPANWKEKPLIIDSGDSPSRRSEELLSIVPADLSLGYDMHQVISLIVDDGDMLEIKSLYARNIITGFSRLGGHSVGIIANNPQEKLGAIDINASDKMARFIRCCDAFNIPLIFLVDTVGYVSSLEQQKSGLERHAAKAVHAICEATVPKITIYIRNCSGWGELAMCTGQMGSDLILAWPEAQIGKIDPEMAVDTIYARQTETANTNEVRQSRIKEFTSQYNNLYHAGARGLIQDIIDPRDTRPFLIEALGWFANKTELRPWKKHGNIPL